MEIKGKLTEIFETVQISDKFKKREFVIETPGQYPELVKMEFNQDKCEQLDYANIGDEVTVWFNIKGRKWTNNDGENKYFVTLQAWKIDGAKSNTQEYSQEGVDELPW